MITTTNLHVRNTNGRITGICLQNERRLSYVFDRAGLLILDAGLRTFLLIRQ